ncbi:hypothetical protein OSSY52_16910 [Tepiditoga spiralis]|uniref:HTH marR-type domain-containing protein n=1 Tax=Tepiditoga spiralis TaxID=2108365 RepID=A0A7G1G4T5_9BACT|nr:MarR family transcriptional regulator [Tepiditoga spiralis]BBE31550.1 hypothetical protein OSSY52_16910 [Tepiditoga spiralis]
MNEVEKGIKAVKYLKNIMNHMRNKIKQNFEEFNLTGPQGMLIGTLAKHKKMKISDLSKELGLSNSTISGIVDRLEKQKMVERIRSEKDRRVVYVTITKDFQKEFQKSFENIEKNFEIMMNNASSEDINSILDGLEKLEKLLKTEE